MLFKKNCLWSVTGFNFASRMHEKRIYVDKRIVSIPDGGLPLAFPGK